MRFPSLALLAAVAAASAVVLSACAPLPPAYVALGDSYVSGPGVPAQKADHPGCMKSDHNYATLAVAQAGIDLRDVSCSGATTFDLFAPQGGAAANPSQLDAVHPGDPVVSVGIGGNDIGFTSIIATCIKASPSSTPCRDTYVHGGTDDISDRITATAPRVAAVLRAVRARAPEAKVLMVGYPDILPDDGVPCFSANAPFTATDVVYLRDKERELNAMLAAQAAANGARYVDTYTPSIGHDICQAPGARWVEGLVPASAAAAVHPNAAGLRATATVVARELRPAPG